MEISIHRALGELKLLQKRVDKAISNAKFVDIVIDNKLKSQTSIETFKANARADLQSINSMIARKSLLKSKIVASNAVTQVKIGSILYTVAEAIEKKGSIETEELLLETLKTKFYSTKIQVDKHNETVQSRLDTLLEKTFSKESSKVNADEFEAVSKPFLLKNQATIIDPLDLETLIRNLESSIDEFKANVDIVLSESNARTMIEIPE